MRSRLRTPCKVVVPWDWGSNMAWLWSFSSRFAQATSVRVRVPSYIFFH